ncbi:MAG: DAK2 domain-containing protein [Bacteroidales bacterium]|nr:DAK2 domain-containing protein [Bacteroidales bacterium]
MITETLTGKLFSAMVSQGAVKLDGNRQAVNDLNVFPVPDGDTGDNMYMTLDAGVREAAADASLSEVAASLSHGMLLGARGNSGVILSRIFAGISEGLSGLDQADVKQFAAAMKSGVESAYHAVSNPVEGTILTVLREGVEGVPAEGVPDLEQWFAALMEAMRASLAHTPELLPVLKDAGVVDSGGAGLLCIVDGMHDALCGRISESRSAADPAGKPAVRLDDFGPDSVLEFGYCTEFLLRLQTAKVGPVDAFDASVIKDYLDGAGDSVVCFRDGSIVKAHVHTHTPGEILSHVQRWGEFLTVKIENMTLQHSEVTIQDHFSQAPQQADYVRHRLRYGIVAVASGAGVVQMFKDAGVEEVIAGGQTMNPSAQDFLEAFDRIDAETILVFPNNSNIILAARQAAELYRKARVVVLPSKSIGEGYVAAASLDRDCHDTDELVASVQETMDSVQTCLVSRAIRDTQQDGVTVHEGDYIGFVHGRILSADPDRNEAARLAAAQLDLAGHDVALVLWGQDTPSDQAQALVERLQADYPRTEIIPTDGAQPVYDYIIVLC